MHRLGFANARFRLRSAELLVAGSPVEVSLDCAACRRRRRTVRFSGIGAAGHCTPLLHPFDGQLLALHASGNVVRAEFRYAFEPFEDAKHGNAHYDVFEAGAPLWVRLTFQLRCATCGLGRWAGTQSNLQRPWSATCRCGAPLYDDVEPPTLGWRNL